jgi:hypothetical protein
MGLMEALTHRVGGTLYKLQRRGFVECDIQGTVGVWRLAGR